MVGKFLCTNNSSGYLTNQICLFTHELLHKEDMPLRFNCKICGKHFDHSYKLKSHNVTHSDEKKFSCIVTSFISNQSFCIQHPLLQESLDVMLEQIVHLKNNCYEKRNEKYIHEL